MNRKLVIKLISIVILILGSIVLTNKMLTHNSEVLLFESSSPNCKYMIKVYRTEPHSTVDFSIRVYLVNDNKEKLIYDAYHEYEAIIEWETEEIVSINEKVLDLSKKEVYSWKRDKYSFLSNSK